MNTKHHDINSLPKWAQKQIDKLNAEIEGLKHKHEQIIPLLENGSDWFVIPNPYENEKFPNDYFRLFCAYKNEINPVCSLEGKDKLVVIRG